MTTIQADPVPLRVDEHGAIRVGGTRITLDLIVCEHRKGMSPEAIAEDYDVLELPDVYGAIAWYLNHRKEVEEYLQRREEEAQEVRKQVEAAGLTNPGLDAVLKKRWAERQQRLNGQNGGPRG